MIWFCIHFQFQERVLFAPFWSSNCSNRPCSGFLRGSRSRKVWNVTALLWRRSMAVVQLPKSLENRSTTTPLVGKPGPPCLCWTSRNVYFVIEKLLKPRGIYPLYLGLYHNDSAQRCSNQERRCVVFEIDQQTDLHAKEVMYHASCYPVLQKVHQRQVPGLRCHCQQGECPKSFWSFSDWAQWQLPDMTWPSNVLPHDQWSRSGSLMMLIKGSAEALPMLCVRYFRWEREREIQRERWRERERERERDGSDVTIVALMDLHFPLPKIRTIGDELTLSLAKNSHFSFLPSHFPSPPSRRGHHCGAEIRNEFTLSIAKKFFALFVPPLSNGTSRATSYRKP